jgi:hypothetical protein
MHLGIERIDGVSGTRPFLLKEVSIWRTRVAYRIEIGQSAEKSVIWKHHSQHVLMTKGLWYLHILISCARAW